MLNEAEPGGWVCAAYVVCMCVCVLVCVGVLGGGGGYIILSS